MDWSSPGVSPPLSANDSPAAQGCAGNRIDPEKVTPFRWLSVARFTAELTSRWKTGKGRHALRGYSYQNVEVVNDMQVIKVIILGAAGVGKTSLIRQFMYSEFSEEYFPTDSKTVYSPTVVFNEHIYSMRIVDLPVIPYFPANSVNEWVDFRNYGLRSASAYILVFDLNDLETFQYVKSIRDQICDTRDMHNVPLFIVGNKQDLLRGRERREVAGLVKKHWKCGYVECSARHNWHVVLLFKELVRVLDYADYGQKLSSYSSPRFESLHAHRDRRGDSVVKCSIM